MKGHSDMLTCRGYSPSHIRTKEIPVPESGNQGLSNLQKREGEILAMGYCRVCKIHHSSFCGNTVQVSKGSTQVQTLMCNNVTNHPHPTLVETMSSFIVVCIQKVLHFDYPSSVLAIHPLGSVSHCMRCV